MPGQRAHLALPRKGLFLCPETQRPPRGGAGFIQGGWKTRRLNEPPVHPQHLAGDKAGAGAGQEQDGAGHFLRLADAA